MNDREKLVELLDIIIQPGSKTLGDIADHLIANGVTFATGKNDGGKWIPVSEPPNEYRDKYGELIPFLVFEKGTDYPFRGLYDGETWGDGFISIYPTHWMPLPEPPKGE